MREAAVLPSPRHTARGAGRSATGPLVLQDGHLVPLLPKGASIFLSMSLQRLLRRWEQEHARRLRQQKLAFKSTAISAFIVILAKAVCGCLFLACHAVIYSWHTLSERGAWRLLQAENHRRQSVAALQKAGNVRSRLAAFEANLRLGAQQAPLPCPSPLRKAATLYTKALLLHLRIFKHARLHLGCE